MESYKITSVAVMVVTWIELLIASLVVFLDPAYNDFPYTTIVFSWPGVLEEVHRIWALVLVVVFILNLVAVLAAGNRGRHLILLSVVAIILLIIQSILGGVTIISMNHPLNVILHEGNAGILMLAASLLAAYALLYPQKASPPATRESQ